MASFRENHYEATMNKGLLNVRWFTRELNTRWDAGWRLDQMVELNGDTLMVWERRPDAADSPPGAQGPAAPSPAAPPSSSGPEGHRPSAFLDGPPG
ncbi:MAG: hypothetical protein JWM47_3107 [Acidimicrobiales bacterium]|nr:hypothetical protein [Acidimicrobiales bacterium]